MSLFTPGLGCSPAETLVGTNGLFARVRADAGAPAVRRRDTAKARSPQPRSGRPQATRRPPAPRADGQEPRAVVLRSFYTCNAAPNLAEGTGWRLVGPLRHS